MSVLFSAVVVSCVWLVMLKSSGKSLFLSTGLTPARWNGWDVTAVFFFFFFLVSGINVLIGSDETESRLIASSTASLLMIYVILKVIRLRGQNPSDVFGLGLRGLAKHMLPGLAAFFVFMPFFAAVAYLSRWILVQLQGDNVNLVQDVVSKLIKTSSPSVMMQIAVAAVIIAPLAEELFFRGFLYGVLRRHVRPVIAIPAVGLLFGATHAPLAAAIPIGLLGCFLCYVYEKTGRLTVPIAIHFLFNRGGIALTMSHRLLDTV